MRIDIILYLLLTVFLSGCSVGPDFKHPEPPSVNEYTASSVSKNLDSSPIMFGNAQIIINEKQVPKYWWRAMISKKIDLLINEALDRNPTLMAAEATLNHAQELYSAMAGSTLYPKIEGTLSGQRQRFNPISLGQTGEDRQFSIYNASASVQYTFDLSGGNRRTLESLAARTDYQRFKLEGVRLTLVANIMTTAILQASLKRQVEMIENISKLQKNQLELTYKRIDLGHGEPSDAFFLQIQLEQTHAKLFLLQDQLQKNEHLLAVLVGRAPGEGLLPSISLEDFNLPKELPLLIPSELVRVRPDILAAEALLKSANAEYGVAISKLYPQLNLSANLGSQALTMGTLFGSGSAIWSLVGQLTQPLFNLGLRAEKRAALAAFNAAAANYQSVVLEALRNVADILRALENDSKRLNALFDADYASKQALALANNRYRFGVISYYDLLISQQQRIQTEFDLIECQSKRLFNTIAFYQAMGGGEYNIK